LKKTFIIQYAIYNSIGKLPLHHTIFYVTAGATLSQSTVIAPACLQYKSFDYFKAGSFSHNIQASRQQYVSTILG
jgi:hypothetical protein